MNLLRIIVPLLLAFLFTHSAQSVTPGMFVWPTNVSVYGETYPFMGVMTTNLVWSPNGQPVTENDVTTHRYHHHTRIAVINNTITIATSSSASGENDGGMQCVLFFSTNRGVNWSAPVQVIPSQTPMVDSGNNSTGSTNYTRTAQPRNFTVYNGHLYLTCAVNHVDAGGSTYIGDALISCAVNTDCTIGSIFLSATNVPYYPSNGAPVIPYNSLLGPVLTADSVLHGTWLGSWPNASPLSPWKQSVTISSNIYQGGYIGLTEPNTFSIDGTTNSLYRIWRGSLGWNYKWLNQQWSADGGATWTSPNSNSVPNGDSEITGARLSTGQYVIVGNPQYTNNFRNTMMVALSDANNTNITTVGCVIHNMSQTPTWIGWGKIAGPSYPGVCQFGNYLYISYSLHKESLGFSRVLIPGLPDNNNDTFGYSEVNVDTVNAVNLRTAP